MPGEVRWMEAETASVPGYWGLAPVRTVILGKFSLAPPFPLKCPNMDNNDTVTLSIDHLWPRTARSGHITTKAGKQTPRRAFRKGEKGDSGGRKKGERRQGTMPGLFVTNHARHA